MCPATLSFSLVEAKVALAYLVAASDGIHQPSEFDEINRYLGHRYAAGRETLQEQRAIHRRVTRKMADAADAKEVLRAVAEALEGSDDRVQALTLALLVARADGNVDPREVDVFQDLADALEATDEELERAWYLVETSEEPT